ncbi:MAG: hypothetical protein ACFE89_00860 [Candidatus Hodarchaeota archaeon]
MLITLTICLLIWLKLRSKKPLFRFTVFLMVLGIAAVTAYFSAFWLIDQFQWGDYTYTLWAQTSFPLSVVGLHDEANNIYIYQVMLGGLGGWWVFSSTIYSPIDVSAQLAQLRLEMGIIIWFLTSVVTTLVLLIAEAIQRISRSEPSSQ